MIQFDEHVFQRGWFNDQLVIFKSLGATLLFQNPPNTLQSKGWDSVFVGSFTLILTVGMTGRLGLYLFPVTLWGCWIDTI